jgi:hypothetical protein
MPIPSASGGPSLIDLQGGDFQMGSLKGDGDVGPVHRVRL